MQTLLLILTEPITLGTLNLPFSLFELITKVALPLLGMFILYFLIKWSIRKTVMLSRFKEDVRKKIIRYTRLVLKILLFSGFLLTVSNLLGSRLNYYFSRFLNILNSPFFVSGKTQVSVITLIMLIPVFYLASWSGKASRTFLERTIFDKLGMDEARKFSFGSISRYVAMTMVLLFGLSIVGLDLSIFGVLLGVLGIGLGFGLQNIVANFFAGLIIISSRPIKEGDRILVNGYDGIVHNIRLVSTDIRTFENENIIIPNSHFVDQPVHNYSYADRKVVIINKVQVSYSSDLEKVVDLLNEINSRNPNRVDGPDNVVRVLSFDDSGITMSLRTMISDVSIKAISHSWSNMEIWRSFKKNGVEIPFPQMDVHVKSMPDKDDIQETPAGETPDQAF
jgi:small-conductance mechanosensitive channel